MAGFTLTEWIAASPQNVFDFMTDPENAPQVVSNVVRSEKITDGPMGVGSKTLETRLTNGKESSMELEVVTWEPPYRYAASGSESGVTVIYHYELKTEGEGTRVDMEADVTSGILMKLMLPMVVKQLQKQDGDHLQTLKAVIESEQADAAV